MMSSSTTGTTLEAEIGGSAAPVNDDSISATNSTDNTPTSIIPKVNGDMESPTPPVKRLKLNSNGKLTPNNNLNYYHDKGSGWRNCVKCNKRGIKDTFYGRNKEFCSVDCRNSGYGTGSGAASGSTAAPGSTQAFLNHLNNIKENTNPTTNRPPNAPNGPVKPPRDTLFRNRYRLPYVMSSRVAGAMVVPGGERESLVNMSPLLDQYEYAPVHAFSNAPLSRSWATLFAHDTVTEVCHEGKGKEYVWPAQVVNSKGYYIKVKLVGKDKYYFLNPGMVNLFPLGHAVRAKKQYGVPFRQYSGHTLYAMITELLREKNTIVMDLFSAFGKELNTTRYDPYMTYEVLDKADTSQYMTARVRGSFGDWVLLRYDLKEESIWTHPRSGFFRQPGWCQIVGHALWSTRTYALNSLIEFSRDPEIRALYVNQLVLEGDCLDTPFKPGMKLEVLDPFDHCMRVATVAFVLRYGFLMIRLDHDSKLLAFHCTSPYLYPATFSELNGIPITIRGKNNIVTHFTWRNYRQRPGETFAPSSYFASKVFDSRFKEKMILETFNLRGHGVVSLVIVMRVIGRILQLDYISHSTKTGFYVDACSPNLLPIGYTNMLQNKHEYIRFDNVPIGDIDRHIKEAIKMIDSDKVLSSTTEVIMPAGPAADEASVDVHDAASHSATTGMASTTPRIAPQTALPSISANKNVGGVLKMKPTSSTPTAPVLSAPTLKRLLTRTHVESTFKFALTGTATEEFFDDEEEVGPDGEKASSSETFGKVCRANAQLFNAPIWLNGLPFRLLDWNADHVESFLANNYNLGKYAAELQKIEETVTGKTLLLLAQQPSKISNVIEPIGDALLFKLLLEKFKENFPNQMPNVEL